MERFDLKQLFAEATKLEEVPSPSAHLINHYFNLNLGNKEIPTPYFINEDKAFHWKRVRLGKGTPEEVESEAISLAHDKGFNLEESSPEKIQEFMIGNNIGIDCSGFATWVLDSLIYEKLHKRIWEVIDFEEKDFFEKIRNRLRPVENIGVKCLASSANNQEITLRGIQPGDLVITQNNQHVMIVSRVGFSENKTPLFFEYVNSKETFGMRKDLVVIKDVEKTLGSQEWIDLATGKPMDSSIVSEHIETAKLVRLKVFSKLK